MVALPTNSTVAEREALRDQLDTAEHSVDSEE